MKKPWIESNSGVSSRTPAWCGRPTNVQARSGRRFRPGITLFEVFVTSSLLGAALVLIPPVVARLAWHRQSVDQQQWATAELNNLLEDYLGRPYNELTPQSVSRAMLTSAAADRLPDAELQLVLEEFSGAESQPDGKKLTATLRWPLVSGGSKRLSLTAWVYAPQPRLPERETP